MILWFCDTLSVTYPTTYALFPVPKPQFEAGFHLHFLFHVKEKFNHLWNHLLQKHPHTLAFLWPVSWPGRKNLTTILQAMWPFCWPSSSSDRQNKVTFLLFSSLVLRHNIISLKWTGLEGIYFLNCVVEDGTINPSKGNVTKPLTP